MSGAKTQKQKQKKEKFGNRKMYKVNDCRCRVLRALVLVRWQKRVAEKWIIIINKHYHALGMHVSSVSVAFLFLFSFFFEPKQSHKNLLCLCECVCVSGWFLSVWMLLLHFHFWLMLAIKSRTCRMPQHFVDSIKLIGHKDKWYVRW